MACVFVFYVSVVWVLQVDGFNKARSNQQINSKRKNVKTNKKTSKKVKTYSNIKKKNGEEFPGSL